MKINNEALNYVTNSQEELIQLIKDLCAIPSFSHCEKQKALYIQEWFKKLGVDVLVDEKYNVILPIDVEGKNNLTVFCAHIDTVFPDETGFKCIEQDGYLYAPGVGDDTANVAELMLIAKYILTHPLTCPNGCLFVFNSCEEGLGNLEGSRHLIETYKGRIREFYSLDLGYNEIITKAVGSVRYKITIQTEGGHSYSAFGNRNAIAIASNMIHKLYEYQVPTRGKSTYNVGVIEGGTSVNTIAQQASFLFEYRSDAREDLNEMKTFFNSIIQSYKNEGFSIEVEVIGERPCMGDVDVNEMENAINRVISIIQHFTQKTPIISSGSTDCNMSYAHGITGCCFGGYIGDGEHTREEKLEIASLEIGMKIVMSFILEYFV